jgi:cytochrome c oxidase subunit 4
VSAEPHARHTSLGTYLLIWAALIVLTLTTVGLTYVDLGEWHTPVGVAIAVLKATLIVLFFMHALESGRLVWMVIAVVVLFLAILWSFTLADFATRSIDSAIRDPASRAAPAQR